MSPTKDIDGSGKGASSFEGAEAMAELRSIKREIDHSEKDCDSAVQMQKGQSLLTSAATQTARSVSTFQHFNVSTSRIDALQAAIERMPQAELPLTHRFTPGMYIRTIFMPAGALVISKIHRTQHPFVVTKGRCAVWQSRDREGAGAKPLGGSATCHDARGSVAKADYGAEIKEIAAGHIGITMPGTRRILYIYEDTEWTTFHATDKTTPEAVEADIIEPHDFDREEALRNFRFAIADLRVAAPPAVTI